jgi:hypothetical protein
MVLGFQSAGELGPARLGGAAALLLLTAWVARSTWSWYRLRHIPGPVLASVSAAWMIRKISSGRFHEHMCKVSDQYGESALLPPLHVFVVP